MTKQRAKIISAACLILSVAITYGSFNFGFSQAYKGGSVSIWLPFLTFFAAIGLVLVAIIIPYRAKNK